MMNRIEKNNLTKTIKQQADERWGRLVRRSCLTVAVMVLLLWTDKSVVAAGNQVVSSQVNRQIEAEQLIEYIEASRDMTETECQPLNDIEVTNGFDKLVTKTFTGNRYFSGKADEGTGIRCVVFYVDASKIPVSGTGVGVISIPDEAVIVRQQLEVEVGSSELFQMNLELDHLGLTYVLVEIEKQQVEKQQSMKQLEAECQWRLYKVLVGDGDKKHQLENMKLNFADEIK